MPKKRIELPGQTVRRVKHRKTTIAGYALIATALAPIAASWLGMDVAVLNESIAKLIPALAGIAAIMSHDGGH